MDQVTQIIEEVKKQKRLPLDDNGQLIKNGFGIKSPRNLVIVKYPKSGSTLSICNVPKILIADSEQGTEHFVPDNVVNLYDPQVENKFVPTKNMKFGYIPETLYDLVLELNSANKMGEFWKINSDFLIQKNLKAKEELYKKLLERINLMPFPILAIDTITSLMNLSNATALYEYNLGVKPESRKSDIKRVDEYGGSLYVRRKFGDFKKFIEQNAAPYIQYHGHIALRKKVISKGEEAISTIDIALEGQLSTIFTSQADAVCTFHRESSGCYLDFIKQDESDLGSRVLGLSNKKIKIADILKEGEVFPKSYWGKVYPEISDLQK